MKITTALAADENSTNALVPGSALMIGDSRIATADTTIASLAAVDTLWRDIAGESRNPAPADTGDRPNEFNGRAAR